MDEQRKKDLLSRATGADRQPTGAPPKRPTVPPPARAIPGITGNPPLPPHPVKVKRTLTAMERSALEKVGWDDSMELPEDIRPALDAASASFLDTQDEVILPVDPRTPPMVPPKEVNYEDLDETRKAAVRDVFATAARHEQEARMIDTSDARLAQIPGGHQAMAATRGMLPQVEIEDDSAKPAGKPDAAPAPGDAGTAGPSHQFCPNCSHDQTQPAGPEPAYEKKLQFLHSILGQKPFFDEDTLFGGPLSITFRTLTSNEIETIFKQAHLDREKGRAPSEVDYWERINRYRLFLQLVKIKTNTDPDGFVEDFPDGLSPETNDMARVFWSATVTEPAPDGETILPVIEAYFLKKPLKTEQKFRICNNASNRFNRMVARLEAMVDNSDFWKPTEERA